MLISQSAVDATGRVRLHSESGSVRSVQSGLMYRKDVLYRGSLHNIPPECRYVYGKRKGICSLVVICITAAQLICAE